MKNEAPFGYCDLCGKKAIYSCVADRYDRRTGKPLTFVHTVYCINHKDRFGDRRERVLGTVVTTNETIPVELFVFS